MPISNFSISESHTGVMDMIETYLLEQLVAFHELKTLSAAAEHLHTSQPSLSRSMQKLEDAVGVPLFERSKNRLLLNENGVLAAECARQVLAEQENLLIRVRALDRSRRTLSVGSAAPGPLYDLSPMLSAEYEDRTIATEILPREELLPRLKQGTCQLAVLPEKPEDDGILACYCGSEHLYASLPEAHPLAGRESVTFAEMDGTEFLQVSQVGIWEQIKKAAMPHARIYRQGDAASLSAVARASTMATFKTDISLRHFGDVPGRVSVPFSDECATVRFWCCCLKKDERQYRRLMQALQARFVER